MPQAVYGSSICQCFHTFEKRGKALTEYLLREYCVFSREQTKNGVSGLAGNAVEYICKKPITAVQTK